MDIYIHDDRLNPTILVPISDKYFLAWSKESGNLMSEWALKNIAYIDAITTKFGQDITPAEAFEKSDKCKKAAALELYIYSGYTFEQLQQIYDEHVKVLSRSNDHN